MNYSNTIFNQLLNFLPRHKFDQFVGQHQGDRYTKRLTTWNQLVALLYAQATGKDSLREIETGLNLNKNTWHHLGIGSVARSSLADANSRRSYQIFEQLFYSLLSQCREIIPEENKFNFKNPLYSFDSTTIELCLNLFDWAKYRTAKGALKIHTLLNNRTTIPELLNITTGKIGDVTALKSINLELPPESIIVFDRAYIDYDLWAKINEKKLFFVSRAKINQNLFVIGQHKSKETLEPNITADEKVMYGDYNAGKRYDEVVLRRIKYWHEKDQREYVYLTNNFKLAASQIANVYKNRWQIELFFKWIKQNLKIKTFLGTSENAVLTQIWTAMIYYLLLAYIKFQTKFKKSLLELTRMIKEVLLIRRDLIDLLSLGVNTILRFKTVEDNPQMSFW
jgi:hypothetical protein